MKKSKSIVHLYGLGGSFFLAFVAFLAYTQIEQRAVSLWVFLFAIPMIWYIGDDSKSYVWGSLFNQLGGYLMVAFALIRTSDFGVLFCLIFTIAYQALLDYNDAEFPAHHVLLGVGLLLVQAVIGYLALRLDNAGVIWANILLICAWTCVDHGSAIVEKCSEIISEMEVAD